MQLACCIACAEEVHCKYNKGSGQAKGRKGFKMNTERLDIRIARSISNYIEMLIKQELKKEKYGKEE